MTEFLFHQDSYLKEFDALIESIDLSQRIIKLDKTAFYPGGGGQPCDQGVIIINGIVFPIIKVTKAGNEINHYVGGEDFPKAGIKKVRGTIDWDRRYQLMRTHTAMHILCGVIFRDHGASVTGGEMDLLKGRMDFEFETLKADFVHEIERAVNQEIISQRDVKVNILPREEAFKIPDLIRTKINLLPEGISSVRTVEIVGLDLQADGGTHVHNTGEVGKVRVVDYKSKGASNKRIYIEVG